VTVDAAISVIKELIDASTEYTKRVNSTRGSKTAERRENRAAVMAFKAITGAIPTAEQIDRMVGN